MEPGRVAAAGPDDGSRGEGAMLRRQALQLSGAGLIVDIKDHDAGTRGNADIGVGPAGPPPRDGGEVDRAPAPFPVFFDVGVLAGVFAAGFAAAAATRDCRVNRG